MNTARRQGESVVSGRGTGRPRKGEPPRVPYEEVDRLLVYGEVVTTEDGQGSKVVYPSYRELALRYGVSNSVIAKYARQHNCQHRRESARVKVAAKAEAKLAELRADAIALSRDDELRIIDAYLLGFKEAIAEGRVRFDNPTDFNTMARLKEFLQGGADSRQEVHAALSLEDLQSRHRQMMKEVEAASAAERGDGQRFVAAPAIPVLDDPEKPPGAPPAVASGEAPGHFEPGREPAGDEAAPQAATGRDGAAFAAAGGRDRPPRPDAATGADVGAQEVP